MCAHTITYNYMPFPKQKYLFSDFTAQRDKILLMNLLTLGIYFQLPI